MNIIRKILDPKAEKSIQMFYYVTIKDKLKVGGYIGFAFGKNNIGRVK
jgi:hypothetical protein